APAASALGRMVTPSVTRVTTPYSWSVPIRKGAGPAASRPAAPRSPVVSSWTCLGLSTLVVSWLPLVGSSALKPTRISPPSRYLAIMSAGVSTPARAWLPAAEPVETFVAESPYAYGISTCPTRSSSESVATRAAARAAGSSDGVAAGALGAAEAPVGPGVGSGRSGAPEQPETSRAVRAATATPACRGRIGTRPSHQLPPYRGNLTLPVAAPGSGWPADGAGGQPTRVS